MHICVLTFRDPIRTSGIIPQELTALSFELGTFIAEQAQVKLGLLATTPGDPPVSCPAPGLGLQTGTALPWLLMWVLGTGLGPRACVTVTLQTELSLVQCCL